MSTKQRVTVWACVALGGFVAGCSSSSAGTVLGGDGGVDASHDARKDTGNDATRDSGHDGGITDASMQTDANDAAVGKTCAQLLGCDNACTSTPCTNACYAASTGVAQGLFNAFTSCLSAACPSGDGGVCEQSDASTCSSCNTSAATGACATNLVACETDRTIGPADPDGGSAVQADAGAQIHCGSLIACESACAPDAGACTASCVAQGTSEAKGLASALNTCLAMACPAGDGGPCATQGPACSGCIEQVELADPDTCAAQYISCNSDGTNAVDGGKDLTDGGVLKTLVTGLDQAASTILVSNNYLYYTEVVTGSPVYQKSLADGGATVELGPPQPTPVSLAVDANNVYVWSVGSFALNSSTNNKDGTVVQVPLDGGTAITLAQNIEVFYDAAYLNAIAVDATNVYWVAGASGTDGAIMKTAIGSSSPTALYTGQSLPQALVTDGTNVYWADWGPLSASGAPQGEGTIWKGPVGGGTAVMLASGQLAPSSLAVDATNLYWTNLGQLGGDNLPTPNSGAVLRIPIAGGTVTTIASAQAVPVSIVVFGSKVFWSQYGLSSPGLIMSAPTAGGPAIPLVDGLNDPAALAITANAIYWTNANSSATIGSIESLSPY